MKKRMTHSRLKLLGIMVLSTCFCSLLLKAAPSQCFDQNDLLNCSPETSKQDLIYSLDEPLEQLQPAQANLSPTPSLTEDKNSSPDSKSQLFYPNLFENNVFNPQQSAVTTETPPVNASIEQPTPTAGQPSAESLSQPVQTNPQPQATTASQPSAESLSQPVQKTPVSQPSIHNAYTPTPSATPPTFTQTPSAPATPTATPPNLRPTPSAPTTLPNQPPGSEGTPPTGISPGASTGLQTPTGTPSGTPAAAPSIQVITPGIPAAINALPNENPQTPLTGQGANPSTTPSSAAPAGQNINEPQKTILINFNNVAITEYIRFISRISNKNFVFDENDLQFTVTIVSEEPTTIDNIMTALLQELRIHDLELIEQDNTIIIHRNSKVTSISKVVPEDTNVADVKNFDIVTKVFRLNTLEVDRAAILLKPMVSATALVEVLKETNHLIITDLSANVREISTLLKSLDSPQSGLVIGQYAVRAQPTEALIAIAQRIIQPIANEQKVIFIPHRAANSIFIVSSPYLVERTISILTYLDQSAATTQILNPRDLNFPQGVGQWVLDKNGNWQFIPGSALRGGAAPRGNWKVDEQGNWYFEPGDPIPGNKGPDGKWVLDKDGNWVFQLNPGRSISPQKVQRKERLSSELPVGHIERTQFSIYKLQYRKGEQIARALGRIAESLALAGAGTNADLLSSINSVQWIESSNSLIFTGTADAIAKMKELIADIDTPLRQVLLEMLILETDITDALNFSTNVAANFGGGNTSGAEAFLSGASTLPAGMATSGVGLIPNAAPQATNVTGFVLGVIGQTITHNGTEYASLGALVKALTQRSITKIVMNPKILTEDNSPAELFVGLNTQFPTQSIANNLGTILTQNFEFRDVGTTLKVTPIIGNNDVVTLEIQEEVSSIVSGGVTASSTLTSQVIGPTTKINRTTTKVHVPNRFFLILSGMLSDQEERNRTQVPCLGSIPVIGAAFSDKQVKDTKQNLMIFIHPIIIDTEEEIDNITRREQNIYRVKNRRPKEWVWETDEAMDFFNIIDTENSDGAEDCY